MTFYEEFAAIGGDAALRQFLNTYGFRRADASAGWNLGHFERLHEGVTYCVGYRWHDPSQAFSIQKDIHKAELWTIDASGVRQSHGQISFPEDA